MLDACIIVCVLLGFTHIGVCLYKLYKAWKSETHSYKDGYIQGLMDGERNARKYHSKDAEKPAEQE